ncbi:MAG TPA: hypothetical protein VFE82_07975 [Ramlibacter sp.]|uniref:hypothetical protein n=1 Tax=Ramlibacter sp. TaxID=1917967 RepID=UPI002D43F722|nr:hypothetical protein [Ramlibacter sp.]HZY18404.1 hypothetical protein [Ramlibacter sp.]
MTIPASFLALTLATLASGADAVEFGINSRHEPELNEAVAALMEQRNFRSARVDLITGDDLAGLRDFARRVRGNGGEVQVVLQTSHQWDHGCDPDLERVEQGAYREAAAAVHQVKDLVHDFELLNEAQRRPEIEREVPWNSAGLATAPYEGKACVASLAAALRGMSRAVADIRADSGLPLRTILGTVGRDFGFLSFMRGQGVQWDVTGFHVYPRLRGRSLLDDHWYGPGGPLAQLAAFGKPVHINEFNCGEIYDWRYENRAGRSRTESCLQSLSRHLGELQQQDAAVVEAVHFYQLLDEPRKPAPENRFGLVHRLGRPKPHLYLAAAVAGGELSHEERAEVTQRGLLTDAQIDAARSRATAAPRLSTRCCRPAPAAPPSSR